MSKLKKHVKILSALSLASSDTRKDTFISIVIRTLYEIGTCSKKELAAYIKEQFGFEPYGSELSEVVDFLVDEKRITCEKNVLSITEDEKNSIDQQDLIIKDQEKSRYQNFKNFITDELNETLDNNELKFLWTIFLEYVYNSFFEYGNEALRTLHPHMPNGDSNGYYENVLSVSLDKLKTPDQKVVFKKIIERFADFASVEDIAFLNDLAQKTLSFSSLGFEPEDAKSTIQHSLVDWVLYLDTNVLYSLLDLHAHPENDSCKALIQLIKDNQEHVKIKLRYSDITAKELGYKKSDFSLLDDKLTDSSIKALLKADELDGFSKKFYESLLENREATIHPAEAIELSQSTLKRKEIEIGRNSKTIENLGESYLNAKVQDFYRFIDHKNESKIEFCKSKNIQHYHIIEKSEKQAYHDITLRELLLNQRQRVNKGDEISLNSIKFFGMTLDGLLISFDRSELRDYNDERSFPVFFKPSFLLNRLVRVLPIKTDDYKKAFIKAVTSRGFNKDTAKSRDILKIVNYLKSQGVDDEKVVYNIISRDIFLEKYHEKQDEEGFNQGEFIESELNREFKEVQSKLGSTEEELLKLSDLANVKSEENKKLESTKEILESDLTQYESALTKLNKRVKQLENQKPLNVNQGALNFEAEDAKMEAGKEKDKANKLSKKLKNEVLDQIENEKILEVTRWQRQIWWNLFWVIPILLAALFFIFPHEWNPITEQKNRFTTSGIITVPVMAIFFLLLRTRYWDEGNKQKRKENHKLSDKLKAKLNEIED
jgi:hypothetical protein